MFGIVWGITSVILLTSRTGHRLQPGTEATSQDDRDDIAIIFGGKTGMQAGGYAAGRDMRLTSDDAVGIQQQASLVKTVSPELRRNVSKVSQ
jgi:putative ABC transport system permease protein